MRRLVSLLCVVALAFLVACSGGRRMDGTFKNYEARPTGQYWNDSSADEPYPELRAPRTERYEPTGYAFVRLSDGTEVKASCPIQGLKSGNGVSVQQNPDGQWVVTGKR